MLSQILPVSLWLLRQLRVKDTAAETLTNAKGEYKFEIPQGSEFLVFSAQGYKSQEVAITKSREYNVKLEK